MNVYSIFLLSIFLFIAANKKKLQCFKTTTVYCTEVAVSWYSGDKKVETD